MAGLNNDEARILSLLRGLLFEADPDADTGQPMSALLLTVWANQFDGINVCGSTRQLLLKLILVTLSLSKIFRTSADVIKAEAAANGLMDVSMEDTKSMNRLGTF